MGESPVFLELYFQIDIHSAWDMQIHLPLLRVVKESLKIMPGMCSGVVNLPGR